MFAGFIVAVVLSVSQPATEPACPGIVAPTGLEQHTLVAFNARIDRYMQLHRQAVQSLGGHRTFDDPEEMYAAMELLQSTIRSARPDAAPGAVFDARVAVLIRERIRRALVACNDTVEEVLASLNEERGCRPRNPTINEPFPWELGLAMSPALLAVLPELPEELQYRFADRALVLIDVDADLVVDVLPDALPPSRQEDDAHVS